MPQGRGIYKLGHDSNAEDSAQEWANGCKFEHSSSEQRRRAGQNLYMTTAQVSTGWSIA